MLLSPLKQKTLVPLLLSVTCSCASVQQNVMFPPDDRMRFAPVSDSPAQRQVQAGAPKANSFQFQGAASFAFLRHARSANLRASLAPRSRQSELMSQSSFGQ